MSERAGACDQCVLERKCCYSGLCWCCDAIDRACRWAITAYRSGDRRPFVASVLRVVTEGAS